MQSKSDGTLDPGKEATVLLVESDLDDGAMVERYLTSKGYRARWARDGAQAVAEFRAGGIDLCVVSVRGPKLDGYDVSRIIKSECGDRFVPVLLVASRRTLADKIAGLDDDDGDAHIHKPYDLAVLHAEIRALCRAKHHHDQRVSERSHFERLALMDPLTGLYNQSVLMERLRHELARARRYRHDLSVCVVQVDDLDRIQSRYGIAVGDRLLKDVARLVRADLREVDLVARIRQSDFVCVLPCTPASGALVTAARLRATVAAHRFTGARVIDSRGDRCATLHDAAIAVTISVGAASFRAEATTPEAMLAEATQALRETRSKRVSLAAHRSPER